MKTYEERMAWFRQARFGIYVHFGLYALLGRDNARNLLACEGENDGISVSGFVSAPHAGRGNRAMQFFFLNGRAFRSATLQAALDAAMAFIDHGGSGEQG